MSTDPVAAPALPTLLVEPIVRAALAEDLGRVGDITTDAIIPSGATAQAALVARKSGRVAGLGCVATAFRLMDEAVHFEIHRLDGSAVAEGEVIATVAGPTRAILSAERVALNFLGRLSGVATATRLLVDAAGHRARICCTRKTTPGLRALEKYAVRVGGGVNHRFGLDDGVLIKDNHIAAAGGIAVSVERARRAIGHMVRIEVEVDTLEQLETALAAGVDAVLLDNMTAETMRRAVALVAGRAITEASGSIRPETVAAVAASGVDLISSGWITHSASALDVGLDFT
jgi:nicotinate-nucleotide pyrophosphorylase (carboxylating)